MPSGCQCHTSDAEFVPVQQICRHVPGSVLAICNVDIVHVVKKHLTGFSTVKLPFPDHNPHLSCVEIL